MCHTRYLHVLSSPPLPLPTPLMLIKEIGYAQGMNDLLARFLVVSDSEVDSYWMFVKYMDYKREDFLEDTMMNKVGEL